MINETSLIGAVILAAGSGTRLNDGKPSEKPKVLYELAGRPMVEYTLDLLDELQISDVVMVVGYKEALVREYFQNRVKYASQTERNGTAHAAKLGAEQLNQNCDHILIIQGDDSAFYKSETIKEFIEKAKSYKIGFTTVKLDEPSQYGRVIRDNSGNVEAIVEKESLTQEQKLINEVNAATYFVDRKWFDQNYPKLLPSAVGKGELIMPDFIKLAFEQGEKVLGFEVPVEEWVGVNTPGELERANKLKAG